MYIKFFRRGFEPVPDPLHPARTVQRPVLVPAASPYPLVYSDASGRHEVQPDRDGGFDVPEEVGRHHCRFRTPEGDGFYPESSIVEQRRLGRIEDAPARRGPGRPRKDEITLD